MLNTVHFDPWQRSLFVPFVSSANTKEKGPLLAGNFAVHPARILEQKRDCSQSNLKVDLRLNKIIGALLVSIALLSILLIVVIGFRSLVLLVRHIFPIISQPWITRLLLSPLYPN